LAEIIFMSEKRAEIAEREARFAEIISDPNTFAEIVCRMSCNPPYGCDTLEDIARSWDVDYDALRAWVHRRARSILNPHNRDIAAAILVLEPWPAKPRQANKNENEAPI
jgi:hypothetical protein